MRMGHLVWGLGFLPLWAVGVLAATLEVWVDHPPATGSVVAWVFDSPNTFVDLRDPVRTVVLSERGALPAVISDLPAGEYALVVFHDANMNGLMDKNFIGIPRERLGFSNCYWPEGPPTFARAAFRLEENETIDACVNNTLFGRGDFGAPTRREEGA